MNIAIVYYSYSGNTDKVARVIEEILEAQGNSVQRLRIDAPDESVNFFVQALRALVKKKSRVGPIETELSAYDLLIFGTPVWAREMAPAMRSYLGQVSGLGGKKAVIYVTYGSGLGKDHCLDSLEKILREKGVAQISRFSLSQFKVGDKPLIISLLRKSIA